MNPSERSYSPVYSSLDACCLHSEMKRVTEETVQIRGKFIFPETFSAFAGHFPNHPILPAVVQLTAVRYLSERALGFSLQLRAYGRIKFSGVILPGEEIVIEIDLKCGDDLYHGGFVVKKEGHSVGTGSCDFSRI